MEPTDDEDLYPHSRSNEGEGRSRRTLEPARSRSTGNLTETTDGPRPRVGVSPLDSPDFELPDVFSQAEPNGGAQNKTLFYLTSSSLNVALLASNVADIMRWVQKNHTADQLGVEILVLLCLMLAVQVCVNLMINVAPRPALNVMTYHVKIGETVSG